MRERLNAFFDRLLPQPPSYADMVYDALNRGASAVSRAGHDAGRYGAAAMPSVDQAQKTLARYGLTAEAIAGLAAPQLRQIQRTAMRTATRHPGSIAGSLFVIGALGLIAYAITRESQQVSAPNIVRSRN
jgi:hypothetical protein